MNLLQRRKQMDRIDARLLQLLNQRATLAVQAGVLKRQRRHPIIDRRREQRVLRQMVEANRGPFSNASIRAVFREILRHSRALQASLGHPS